MKRNELKIEDTWDLTKLFKDNESFNKACNNINNLSNDIILLKGHILDNEDNLYKYLTLNEKLSLLIEKVYVYSYLTYYEDTTNELGKTLKEKAENICTKVNSDLSFTKTEIISRSYSYIKRLLKDKRLSKYKFYFEELYRYKKYTLSEKEEKIITLASNALGNCSAAFSSLDNADCSFKSVYKDSLELPLNHSTYQTLIIDKDRMVRKSTFKNYYEYYINHKNTLASLYKGQVMEDDFLRRVRNFNSSLECSLYEDNISVNVYNNLIKEVHNNLDILHDYIKFRKEFLGLDELHMYDINVELCNKLSNKYTFDEAVNLILEVVKPLGEEYVSDMKKGFNERWIDKYNCIGKRSGAYEWGVYDVSPYVSVNFEGDYTSVSTVIHEMGHAMHSYYSNKSQDFIYAGYPIFLAEIASTVNEVLLNEYMIKTAKKKEEKLYYITKFLDEFKSTVYRQTHFAEFEFLTHKVVEDNEPLTEEKLYQTYYDLNKLYYGKDIISDEEIGYEWSRVPHFYTSFYVYKYATGFSCAIKIANDILNNKENALDNYLKFLSSGGSDYPLNILKKCGIDLESGEVIKSAISMFKDRLELAKKLRKEILDGKE